VHEDRSVKEDSGRGAIPLTHTFAIHQAAMGQVSVKQHEKSEMPYLDGWHGFHHDFIMISSIMCVIGDISVRSFGGWI
jgi:hypothetical protein